MTQRVLAIIGGSGFYAMDGVSHIEEIELQTPYGPPSDRIVRGQLGDAALLFLPRHGRGHRLPPHRIDYRANVCALKQLGATQLLSISAVGSMKEYIEPGHFVVVDQFIDLTRRRVSTFFDEDFVAHVGFADPICPDLSRAVAAAAERAGVRVHRGGTYVCIDGPQFSTRAESSLYRSWGVSVIGMTAMPEAKLAREAELPYALLALSTDYDCWHDSEADVTVEAVLGVLKANVAGAQRTLAELAVSLPDPSHSPATRALANALVSDPNCANPESLGRLRWLLGKYISKEGSS